MRLISRSDSLVLPKTLHQKKWMRRVWVLKTLCLTLILFEMAALKSVALASVRPKLRCVIMPGNGCSGNLAEINWSTSV